MSYYSCQPEPFEVEVARRLCVIEQYVNSLRSLPASPAAGGSGAPDAALASLQQQVVTNFATLTGQFSQLQGLLQTIQSGSGVSQQAIVDLRATVTQNYSTLNGLVSQLQTQIQSGGTGATLDEPPANFLQPLQDGLTN